MMHQVMNYGKQKQCTKHPRKNMATKQLGTYFRNSRSAFYVGTMTERYAFINHFNFLSIESFITEAV
jgi:hypothetical protein